MNIPTQCDVVVVGGGPAGSMTGAFLQQKGHNVVLFDKQQHPRYAVGESLIPDFWKYTDLLGVTEKIEAEGFLSKAGGLINWKNQPRAHNFSDFGYTRPALHVERDRFDHILLEHAQELGVQVFEGVSINSVRFDKDSNGLDQPRLTHRNTNTKETGEITCKYVVDASGQSTIVGRQLGLRSIDEDFRFMSVWGYFENSKYFSWDGKAYTHDQVKDVPPTTYVSSLGEAGDLGWSWHIALRDSTSVGLVLPLNLMKDRKQDDSWEEYFLKRCSEIPVLQDLLAEASYVPDSLHMTRDYSYTMSDIAGPGYFLVGDAAGFVDPIFSVGCVMSCYSAYAAAWALDRCLKQPENVEQSQALYARQVQGRLEIARTLALPRYQSQGETSDLAKDALKLQRNDVQDLMQVVSTLTTRSENFDAMQQNHKGEAIKLKVYERLEV